MKFDPIVVKVPIRQQVKLGSFAETMEEEMKQLKEKFLRDFEMAHLFGYIPDRKEKEPMPKIARILVLAQPEAVGYAVGQDGITEIKNMSEEYEDHIHVEFHVYAGTDLAAAIGNAPVVVEFFVGEDGEEQTDVE